MNISVKAIDLSIKLGDLVSYDKKLCLVVFDETENSENKYKLMNVIEDKIIANFESLEDLSSKVKLYKKGYEILLKDN